MMHIKRIADRNGVSVRYGMSTPRGKLLLLLLGLWITAVAIVYFLSDGLANFSKWGFYNYLKVCVLAALIPIGFMRPCFQLDYDGKIRRGFTILDFNIWLIRVDVSEVSSIRMDDSDSSNIVIRLYDRSKESLLAIEGFRSKIEADQFYHIIVMYAVHCRIKPGGALNVLEVLLLKKHLS